MLTLRRAADRGHFDHGWLDTYHTFSFADYHDRAHMGFRVLRVMNEDHVAPGQGFGMHPHRDMEIITWLLAGALEHQDSLGHGAVLRPGEVQRITAGTGILHSEFNPSATEPVHLYQIWLRPDRHGHQPGYDQKAFPEAGRQGQWQILVSPDGREGSLTLRQNAIIQVARLAAGQQLPYKLAPGRFAWLQILRGEVRVGKETLQAGDGAALGDETSLLLEAASGAEVMLFDLP